MQLVGSSTLEAEAWLREVYDEFWAPMVRLATLLLGSSDQSEEIVQDAILAVFSRRERFRDGSPAGYLRASVVNACRSAHRHREVVARKPPPPSPEPAGPAELAEQSVERTRMLAALRTLPQRQQEVLILRFYEDLSEADIASALGISKGSVKSHGHRGMTALREALGRGGR